MFERRTLATPPGRDRWQREVLAQQPVADRLQESEPACRFEHTGPQRIGKGHTSRAHDLQQTWNAERRVRAQFRRIAEVIIQSTQHRMHSAQARESLEIQGVATDGEIRAFDQRQSELTCEIRMLEVGFVEWAGGEHDGEWRFIVSHVREQLLTQCREEAAGRAYAQILEYLRKHARDDAPVFERIPRTRRCLSAIAENPPLAIRRPRKIDRVDMQPMSACRTQTATGPQKVRMPEHDLRRHDAFREQSLRSVQIAQQSVEQSRALSYTGGDRLPFLRGQNQRQDIELPGTVTSLRIGVDVVRHAVLHDQPTRQLHTAPYGIRSRLFHAPNERLPVIAHRSLAIEQLVVTSRVRCVGSHERWEGHGDRR